MMYLNWETFLTYRHIFSNVTTVAVTLQKNKQNLDKLFRNVSQWMHRLALSIWLSSGVNCASESDTDQQRQDRDWIMSAECWAVVHYCPRHVTNSWASLVHVSFSPSLVTCVVGVAAVITQTLWELFKLNKRQWLISARRPQWRP